MRTAVQDDGKLVVVGAAGGEPPTGDFAVARYLPDGTLDPTFSGDGKVVTPIDSGFDEARAVAIDASGRMVVVGHTERARFAVARYLADGTLDPAFGGDDGIVTTDFTPGFDIAHGVAIQPDGRIVVPRQAGSRQSRFAVARYLADGTLDPAFGGGGGKVRTRMGTWGNRASGRAPARSEIHVYLNTEGLQSVRFADDGSVVGLRRR